jgi:DNA topoisomerase-1
MAARHDPVLDAIAELHEDAPRCAEIAGLHYVQAGERGIRRRRHGKGFAYRDARDRRVNGKVAARIRKLAIPPAWHNVWICPDQRGHLLATGEDDRGRTQYLYHPRWRELRDLLNFYRLLVFGEQLPTIRTHVAAQLRRRSLDRERVLAAMLRIIDESAVRIGSQEYAENNDSFGLSTLTKRHVHVRGRTVELAFPGKSGQRVHVSINDAPVARALHSLLAEPGRHVFQVNGTAVSATDVNDRLLELTSRHITAKDFRTWNGTLAAYAHLRDASGTHCTPRRTAIAAIDEAAQQLANTRAVARAHYVHPHVVAAFTNNRFEEYLATCTISRHEHLDRDECELLAFLRVLLEHEFDHRGIGR